MARSLIFSTRLSLSRGHSALCLINIENHFHPLTFIYHVSSWGRFHKAKTPKCVLQNAKIFKAFSMFNFITALTPKFSQHTAKNDGVFKVQFHNTNLALKTPKWATFFWRFHANKKCWRFGFMKWAPGRGP